MALSRSSHLMIMIMIHQCYNWANLSFRINHRDKVVKAPKKIIKKPNPPLRKFVGMRAIAIAFANQKILSIFIPSLHYCFKLIALTDSLFEKNKKAK